ncbi:MAG: hypothetical protein K2K50_00895 [Anaeroplasmataceae bacterium]|nr:hypothetical protein [Anaeroplasmataceae bacterium]
MKKIISFIGIILCSLALFSCKDKGFEEAEPSDKMKEQIALDYQKQYEVAVDDEIICSFGCQGKYKNIYFVCFLSGWWLGDQQDVLTDNYRIKIYVMAPIRAYYNHKFYNIEEIYNNRKVPESVLLGLSDYTKEHDTLPKMKLWSFSLLEMRLVPVPFLKN